MKRFSRVVFLAVAGLAACAGEDLDVGAVGSAGEELSRTARRASYYLAADGSLETPRGRFASLADWYLSDTFTEAERCRAQHGGGHTAPGGWTTGGRTGGSTPSGDFPISGGVTPTAAPTDCTMAFTNIEDEYHLDDTKLIVPVVFHNIYRDDHTGLVQNEAFLEQIEILNEDFRAIPDTPGENGPLSEDVHIEFVLAGVTRVENDAWFDDPEAHEVTFKNQLAWDEDRYLNVYTVGPGVALGWATFAQEKDSSPWGDGVVLLFDTIGRDGPNPPYNQGRTATHEVGHYLGLLHTFAPNDDSTGVCTNGWNAGDLIQDTDAQSEAEFACPLQTTTCGAPQPSTAGNVHNYMNYTDDECMFYFTIQQANRAVCGLVNHRPALSHAVGAEALVTSDLDDDISGKIFLTKAPLPIGMQLRFGAMPLVFAKNPLPTWDARIRLHRKLPGSDTWEHVATANSSGLNPAELTHTVTQKASYRWSVTRTTGETPVPPHTLYVIRD